jgi:DHA2 family multidrug resistance protein
VPDERLKIVAKRHNGIHDIVEIGDELDLHYHGTLTKLKQAAVQRQDVSETGLRRVLIVAAVMAAALMQTLDSTITNVALPNIQGNLGASQDEGTWIVTAYTISSIVIIPLTPWLQSRFGRRNYFVASIIGFTVASMFCGSSGSLVTLIFWRVVQGGFGGGLLATAQSILRDTFPPKQLGLSQGIFAIGAIMGPALGPPLGGLLVDNASWNLVFYINVVPGIFAAIVLMLMLKDPGKAVAGAIDVVGLVLLTAGLGSMQYVLTEGEQNYWFADPTILAMALVMVVTLVGFVFWELFGTGAPVVDLRILRNRSVAAGSFLAVALGVVIFGSTYTLPQFSQGPLGFTPSLSGFLFIFRAAPILVVAPLIVRLTGKVDPRVFLALGFIIVGIGTSTQAWVTTSDAGFWTFAIPLALTGAGSAMLFIPLSIAILGATTPAEGPKASAFINLSTQLGGSIAVAGLSAYLDQRQSIHADALRTNATLSNVPTQEFLKTNPLTALSDLVNGQALILAYSDATMVIAVVAFVGIPFVLLMRKGKPPAAAAEPKPAQPVPAPAQHAA